jgi:hypothetical protein
MSDQQQVTIKQQNLFSVFASNWPLFLSIMSVIITLAGFFYRVPEVEADVTANTSEIRSLEARVNVIEGDIKAIRYGIDFLVKQEQD